MGGFTEAGFPLNGLRVATHSVIQREGVTPSPTLTDTEEPSSRSKPAAPHTLTDTEEFRKETQCINPNTRKPWKHSKQFKK